MPTESAFAPVYVDINGLRQLARTPEQLALYLKSGGIEITPDMVSLPYEGELRERAQDRGLETFGTGAVEALTAGLYTDDSYLGQIDKEENPLAYAGGQATGLVGGALAVPFSAPGMAARAGTAAAGGITSTVGRLAAEGAVDALTYATTQEAIGAIVHDKKFSVEAIAAQTLAGGGIGGALGLAAKGAGALKRALTKQEVAAETLKRVAASADVPAGSLDAPASASFEATGTPTRPMTFTDDVVDEVAGPVTKEWGDLLERVKTTQIVDDAPLPQFSKSRREFFRDMPHMEAVDKQAKQMWEHTDDLDRDMALIGGDNPEFRRMYDPRKGDNTWAKLQRARREVAEELRLEKVEIGKADTTGRSLESRYKFSDDAWRRYMASNSPEKISATVAKYDEVIQLARKLDSEIDPIRKLGPQYFHVDQAMEAAVRGRTGAGVEGARPTGTFSKEAAAAEVDKLAGRMTSDTHEAVKRIMRSPEYVKDAGMVPGKTFTPTTWDGGKPRNAASIKEALSAGEHANLEEVIQLPLSEQRAVFDSLRPEHWASLSAELRTNPKIVSYAAKSAPDRANMWGAGVQAKRAAEWAQQSAPKSAPSARAYNIDVDIPSPADAIPGVERGGIIGTLMRTNALGAAAAFMFPKAMAAKVIIEKYGARLAGAAEKALSNKTVSLVARKAPVIAWAKLMAPGGEDRDRNIRAIQAIAESPEAFSAAVDSALDDIETDSPQHRIEAQETVTRQLQWLVENVPSSLSTMRNVYSPTTIAHFNRLVHAWQDPIGTVLADVGRAPTEMIDAVRALWPDTYGEFMEKLVEGVSERAAAGQPVPRAIGRILPMVSPSWSQAGMQQLQATQNEPVQMGGGKMNATVVAPQTASESMSQNRIQLNNR